MSTDITSPTNDRIKWLVRLRDRRHRDTEGVFLVEGDRLYRRALAAGMRPRLTFVAPNADIETSGETLTVDRPALDKASYRQRSEGVIGVFSQIDTRLRSVELPPEPLVLVAEDIEKPGNLGAMLRTAGAAGADALVAVGDGIDPHNPNVIRASTGALFTLPLVVSTWEKLEAWLADGGLRLVCSSPDASRSIWETDLRGPVALVVGAEDEGLSDRARVLADEITRIPQTTETVDSLNVSVAAAILLFEARRQRT